MESRGCPKRNGMPSLGVYSTSGPNWCDLYFSVIIFPSIVNRHCAGKCAPFTDREADTGAEVQQCVVICRAQEHDGIVKNCYATVHCHLSEYELYIYGNSPVRQCNGVMCWGSFSSKFFSWEWENISRNWVWRVRTIQHKKFFEVGLAAASCFSLGIPPYSQLLVKDVLR